MRLTIFLVSAMLGFASTASAQYVPGNYSTISNAAGTITAGGTAQGITWTLPQAKIRCVQNPKSAIEDLFVNYGGTAGATGSIDLQPGLMVCWPWNGKVSVFAVTTSHAFVTLEGQ